MTGFPISHLFKLPISPDSDNVIGTMADPSNQFDYWRSLMAAQQQQPPFQPSYQGQFPPTPNVPNYYPGQAYHPQPASTFPHNAWPMAAAASMFGCNAFSGHDMTTPQTTTSYPHSGLMLGPAAPVSQIDQPIAVPLPASIHSSAASAHQSHNGSGSGDDGDLPSLTSLDDHHKGALRIGNGAVVVKEQSALAQLAEHSANNPGVGDAVKKEVGERAMIKGL